MHRALQIQELVGIVFSLLDPDTLKSLVRTCRSFWLPAASQLWKTARNDSFFTLANNFLEMESWKTPNQSFISTSMYTHRHTRVFSVEAKWLRFQSYASLIRTIQLDLTANTGGGYTDGFPEMLDDMHQALQRISSFSHSSNVLPHLRYLEFQSFEARYLDNLFMFLGPSLEELTVKCFSDHWEGWMDKGEQDLSKVWAMPVGRLFDSLPFRCPHLHKFRFRQQIQFDSIHLHSMIEMVIRLPRLSYFETDIIALHPDFLATLAGHPSLKELHIGYFAGQTAGDEPPNYILPAQPFTALRSFHLFVSDDFAAVILSFIPPQLDELVLRIENDPVNFGLLAEIAEYIPTCQPHLRKLDLHIRNDRSMIRPRPPPTDWCSWTPILRCSGLTHFRFNWRSTENLDLRDHHVLSMAQAWSGLKFIKLYSHEWALGRNGLAHDAELTLAALGSLAQFCPDLEDVELSYLDLMLIPIPPLMPMCQHVLELKIHMSQTSFKADVVAAYLFTLWPMIRVSGRILEIHAKERNVWLNVDAMLSGMRSLRMMDVLKRQKGIHTVE